MASRMDFVTQGKALSANTQHCGSFADGIGTHQVLSEIGNGQGAQAAKRQPADSWILVLAAFQQHIDRQHHQLRISIAVCGDVLIEGLLEDDILGIRCCTSDDLSKAPAETSEVALDTMRMVSVSGVAVSRFDQEK